MCPTNNVLIISSEKNGLNLRERVCRDYLPIVKNRNQDFMHILGIQKIDCIVMHLDLVNIEQFDQLHSCKQKFSSVPLICIIEDINLELVLKLGYIGIDKVMLKEELGSLNESIKTLTIQSSASVKLFELGIDLQSYSGINYQALKYMETNYIQIMSLGQIEKATGISENILSREFKKLDIPNPKKLLLIFKIMHAVKLMRNKGLGLKQIANYSGFSCQKRLNEGFHRIFPESPSCFRNKRRYDEIDIWRQLSIRSYWISENAVN